MDKLYRYTKQITKDFSFDADTASVFNDMLKRSVPHYDETQEMICALAKTFAQQKSNIYDLGCSTGNTLARLQTELKGFPVNIIGIDSSEAMLKKAAQRIKRPKRHPKCQLSHQDLNNNARFNNASVIIANLTLHFVRPINKDRLIAAIYKGLNPGGAFILVEKIIAKDPKIRRMFIKLHQDFKHRKGYSKLEISKKREALENVLIPYMYDENAKLLKKNGFQVIDEFFRWYNFCGILAVK